MKFDSVKAILVTQGTDKNSNLTAKFKWIRHPRTDSLIYLFIYLFWLVMDRYAILESFWFRTSYLQFWTSDFGLRTSHSQPYPTSINFICGSLEPWVWSRVAFIYWWTYPHRKGRCYYSWLIFYFAQLNAMYHTISVAKSAMRICKLRNILTSS